MRNRLRTVRVVGVMSSRFARPNLPGVDVRGIVIRTARNLVRIAHGRLGSRQFHAVAAVVVLSITGLSWTIPGPSISVDYPMPAIDPISPHQNLVVEGIDYTRPISDWASIPSVPLELIDDETVWLARCIYSETKDPREMELVAWVVRNRVETGYRDRTSYRSTVLDPFQFSAFNDDSIRRNFYASLQKQHEFLGWQDALRIAYLVKTDDGRRRPFSAMTRHFYSEISMVGRSSPVWTSGYEPVNPPGDFKVDAKRFRFFEDIS